MKGFKFFISIACVLFSMTLLESCFAKPAPPLYEEREVGDFVVRFYEDYCEIKGTTAQGNEKKFLVIPAYIDGVRVESLGVYRYMYMSGTQIVPAEIESEKLEKVFFESAIKMSNYSFSEGCPNIKKVMYPNLEVPPYYMNKRCFLVFYPRSIYENGEHNLESLYRTEMANVSYYYNYEGADNSGYYFIDDCDYGGKIEFIPKEPVRENYTFGGWYKEAECINEWDFEADTLPQEITEPKENIYGEIEETVVYQETILYAKWTLNY